MRLHRLEAQAFGPFAERVVVDLDAVAAGGLFLVHGPTGSGKTSLLDAVCFALYADVPGTRPKQGLRSDHAAPDLPPEVVLELTVGGRRLRVTRSPGWSRPKRRGTGTTPVQARVLLEEHVGGQWQALSTRNDEVADVVLDLLGMGLRQFASVVLLPQGEFATFLRADPEERRRLLERLFDIGVYADVEQWLADARRDGSAELDAARAGLETGLLRLDDALAALPADPDGAAGPAAPGSFTEAPLDTLPDRLAAVARDLDAHVTAWLAAVDTAEAAEAGAQAALTAARTLSDTRVRGLQARVRLEALDAEAVAHHARRAELELADRAAALTGHLRAHDRAAAEEREAQDALTRAAARLEALGCEVTGSATDLLALVGAHDGAADALARGAATARSVATDLDAATDERDRTAAERARLAEALPALTSAAAAADEQVDRVRGLAGTADGAQARVESLRVTLDALDEVDAGRARAADLAPALLAAREALVAARETRLDLRRRRLDEMAATLAEGLEDGVGCPVCGSAEHPEPAVSVDGVTPEEVEAAEALVEQARTDLADLERELTEVEAAVRTRVADLGDVDRPGALADLEAATAQLCAARAARAELVLVLDARDAARTAADEARVAHERAGSALAVLESRVERLTTDAGEAAAALDAALAEHAGCPCGSTDPAAHRRVRDAADAHARAEQVHAAARSRLATAAADLAEAVAQHGFDDVDSAVAARRDPSTLDRLRDAVLDHDRRVEAARAVLADPDVVAALDAMAPDLERLEAALRDARSTVLTAVTSHEAVSRAARALGALRHEVESTCRRIGVLADRQARVRELADAVGGTGGDNVLRMRLTSFVLAARLEKVAALANERLAVMGGGRYLLEHTDERAARGARSGLGLRVLDQWTGRTRDTASLSGGESFMASLALALGLADAVREETGGLDLGTLFVDEGFGTLDDESLEQVLAVLDGLREGGRAVGVVSHVADLRSRVPHQVVVTKGSAGSSVTVRTGVEDPAA